MDARRLAISWQAPQSNASQHPQLTSSGGCNLSSLGKGDDSEKPKGPNGKLNRVKYLQLSLQLPTSSPLRLSVFPKLSCSKITLLSHFSYFRRLRVFSPFPSARSPPTHLPFVAHVSPGCRTLSHLHQRFFFSFGNFKPCHTWQLTLFVAV